MGTGGACVYVLRERAFGSRAGNTGSRWGRGRTCSFESRGCLSVWAGRALGGQGRDGRDRIAAGRRRWHMLCRGTGSDPASAQETTQERSKQTAPSLRRGSRARGQPVDWPATGGWERRCDCRASRSGPTSLGRARARAVSQPSRSAMRKDGSVSSVSGAGGAQERLLGSGVQGCCAVESAAAAAAVPAELRV